MRHCQNGCKNMAPTGDKNFRAKKLSCMIKVSGCWLFSHSSFFSYWIEVIHCQDRRLYNGKTPFYMIYSLGTLVFNINWTTGWVSTYFKIYESLHVINLYYVKFIYSVWECKYFTRLPDVEGHCKTNKRPSTADNNNIRSQNISAQL